MKEEDEVVVVIRLKDIEEKDVAGLIVDMTEQ